MSFWIDFLDCLPDDGETLEEYQRKIELKTASVRPQIEKVIFNDPATIVNWSDGTKTVVKCGEGDKWDPEKGIAMAVAKKYFGNTSNWYEKILKWTAEPLKEKQKPKPKQERKTKESSYKDIDDLKKLLGLLW